MKLKKTVTVLFTLVIAIMMIACSNRGKSSSGSGDKEIVLSVALNMDIREAFEKFFAAFEEANPGIKIDLVDMPSTFEEFLQTRIAQGNLPDVFSISGNAFGSDLADNDRIMDLRGTAAAERIIDSVKPAFTSKNKNKLFGITYGVSTTLLYYNLDMLEAAGVEKIPNDWKSFLDVCAKVKASGVIPVSLTLGDGSIGNTSFSYGFGNNVANNNPNWKSAIEAGTFNFNTPEIADIFERIKYLIDQGYAQDGAISTQYQQGIDLFTQGKTAMYFGGIWFNGAIASAADFKYNVGIPPWNDDVNVQNVVVGTETGWGVSESTAYPEAALKLMDFFTGDGYLILQNGRMSVPAVKNSAGTVLSPQVENILPTILTAERTSQLYFEYLPLIIQENLPRLYQETVNGTLTPAQAAFELDKLFREG
jgi:multiple sugar transport system substrate-binding protein/raffinose/stachyose/melibiose transport system substrate-binding protein